MITRDEVVRRCEAAMITRDDVMRRCDAADAMAEALRPFALRASGDGPTWGVLDDYIAAFGVWLSWRQVLISIDDDGVDPTIAALSREYE